MDRLRLIVPGIYVAGQITAGDIATAAAKGVVRIINNRPDDEELDQPASARIMEMVRGAGLDYVHIPITGMPGGEQVEAVGRILADGQPTLLYCRSGMRSAAAWALATSMADTRPDDEIRLATSRAGYDLSRLPLRGRD